MPRTRIFDLEPKTETLTDLNAPRLMALTGGDGLPSNPIKGIADVIGGTTGGGGKAYNDKGFNDKVTSDTNNKQLSDKAAQDNHSDVYQDGGEIGPVRPPA